MSRTTPRVSVCLPVYNGERHLRFALDSILAQSLGDFELVLADNASTDGTAAICRDLARRDARVRYLRAHRNLGLAWNFNNAARVATADYMVWIGHDDVMGPNYLQRCYDLLRAHPDAVLSFTNSYYLDDSGQVATPQNLQNTGEDDAPSDRMARLLYDNYCDPVCGMMRREVLLRTRMHGPYADSDRVMLIELALRGRFVFDPERCFYRRMHPHQSTAVCPDRWSRTLLFDPSKANRIHFPWVREGYDLFTAARDAPIGSGQRYKCWKYLYWWVSAHRQEITDDLRQGWLKSRQRWLARPQVAPA